MTRNPSGTLGWKAEKLRGGQGEEVVNPCVDISLRAPFRLTHQLMIGQ